MSIASLFFYNYLKNLGLLKEQTEESDDTQFETSTAIPIEEKVNTDEE
jgi:hypothetical protein